MCVTATTITSTITTTTSSSMNLWIGGSSSLAETYFYEYRHVSTEPWLLLGIEDQAPEWIQGRPHLMYVKCDVTEITNQQQAQQILQNYPPIANIIVGLRPPLWRPFVDLQEPQSLTRGIELLLTTILSSQSTPQTPCVIHISSVAAANHLQLQTLARETDPLLPLESYAATYDRFKRLSEDVITKVCQQFSARYIHLRISAIFSLSPKCLQCIAMTLLKYMGTYVTYPIDGNSSVNVCRAVQLLLHRPPTQTLRHDVYYYTRPLLLPKPVPFGYYLQEHRQAYQITGIWIPTLVVTWLTAVVHWLVQFRWIRYIPYVEATDYLLQVAAQEHSFDCSRFAAEFGDQFQEESILECFQRRILYLQEQKQRIRKQHQSQPQGALIKMVTNHPSCNRNKHD